MKTDQFRTGNTLGRRSLCTVDMGGVGAYDTLEWPDNMRQSSTVRTGSVECEEYINAPAKELVKYLFRLGGDRIIAITGGLLA